MQGEFQFSTPRKYVMSVKRDRLNQETSPSICCASTGLVASDVADADYVGYSNIPQQIYRRAVRRGFEFTLMVIGESGLGKSTFINNLFLSDIYGPDYPGPTKRIKKTIELEETKVHLIENGINLYLTVVDVPGFGDSINNSGCWLPIVKFIDDRHQQYLDDERKHKRELIVDNRVHCCLYFVSPWGYGLKPIDIQVLKNLHERVNIVPVIAKADSFTSEECLKFKEAIMNQIEENDIKIYDFTSLGSGDEISNLKNQFPFAVMGSLSDLYPNGKLSRGRKYPWGNAEVENSAHCDFIALRNLLIRIHMHNLKTATRRLYEIYRYKILLEKAEEENHYITKLQDEKRAHDLKLRQLAEEMENIFDRKIAEKVQKLKESEAELENRSQQMAETLKQERQELEEKRAEIEREKAAT